MNDSEPNTSKVRLAGILIFMLVSVCFFPLNARADVDPVDNYWLRQLRTRPVVTSEPGSILPAADTSLVVIPAPTVGALVVAPASGFPTWIPVLSPTARALLRRSIAAGHDPHFFTIAGDSNSNPIRYLARVISGAFDLTKYPDLKPVIGYYAPSFTHVSISIGGGFRAAEMFDTSHIAGFDACHNDEGMFACELRTSNASIVFIQLGTGDKFAWREFEHNYRAMLDHAAAHNVLPILVTKADDIESLQGGASYGYINGIIRALAAEYQLPLLDMYAATRNLPVIPNPELPKRPFTQYGLQDEWGYYFHLNDIGQDRHVLITLQTLASIGS
jgi:hypothetical protein